MRRKLTPKQLVLAKFPEAIVWHWADGWCIYTKPTAGEMIGESGWKDQRRAWRSAAIVVADLPSETPVKRP